MCCRKIANKLERKFSMPQISIIVPVYKVEHFLMPCVDSILSQTYSDYELILIDDGSPDQCGMICDQYAQKDNRVLVIHQSNMGLSGARNSGLDIAKGEFIAFIDSDDMVRRDYLEKMFALAKKESADIVVCRMLEFDDSKIPNLNPSIGESEFFIRSNVEACKTMYNGNPHVSVNACNKLIRKSIIEDIRFPLGRLHEDQAIMPIVYYRASKVASIMEDMYFYRTNLNGITKTRFTIKRYDDIWAVDKCMEFFRKNGEQEIISAAAKKRKRLICVYSIYAYRDKVKVPKEYRIHILRALTYLRKNVSEAKFEWYLAQVDSRLVRPYEYFLKLCSLFRA